MKLLEHENLIDIVKIDPVDDGIKFVVKKDGSINIVDIQNSDTSEQLLFLTYEELEPTIRALISCKRFLKDYE